MTIPFLHVSVAQALLIVGLVASTGYYLVMLYGTYDFFRRYKRYPLAEHEPPVTFLKPLKGAEPSLRENLESLCRQQYGTFQVLCGVADPNDPAIAVVRKLQAEHPDLDIELVVDPHLYGSNDKISNLHNMYRRAKHDIIIVADSDIRVRPDYLRKIVAQVLNPRTGLVTCLYRAVNTGGIPSLLESMFVNTDFCGMVLVARKVERPSYAFGATIAMRREVLDQVGGFLPLVNYLADDYQLGNRISALGYNLVLSDEIVETVVAVDGWRTLLQHQVRWARTYRACRATGYFTTIITHGTLWALVNLVYQGFSPAGWLVAAGVLGLRYACAGFLCWPYLGSDTRPHQLAILWLKDLLVSCVWFLAFASDTVWWSGRRFRILSNGEMTDLTPGASPVESWRPHPISALPQRKP
jgi:ceramide glucosyltransferase